jgi:hypothetical protein
MTTLALLFAVSSTLRHRALPFAWLFAFVLTGCDGDAPRTTRPTATAAVAPASSGAATAAAAPIATAAVTPASTAPAKGVPTDVAALELPAGSAPVTFPDNELYEFQAPKGAKIAVGEPYESRWLAFAGGGLDMSVRTHNPSGDDGPDCPTVAAIAGLIGPGKRVIDRAWTTETVDLPDGRSASLGDEVALVLFEKGGKFGFYGRKKFSHGDDFTSVCCALGKPADAAGLAALADEATAKAAAAVCMSLAFKY